MRDARRPNNGRNARGALTCTENLVKKTTLLEIVVQMMGNGEAPTLVRLSLVGVLRESVEQFHADQKSRESEWKRTDEQRNAK